MLKTVQVDRTYKKAVHEWQTWTVEVPDDMPELRIEELVKQLVANGDLYLGHYAETNELPSVIDVDVYEARKCKPGHVDKPDFTLTEKGIVHDELSEFSSEQLLAELKKRQQNLI
jgi:hypothetical protein